MKQDDVLLAIAAINYKELEIERMINPQRVDQYYPEDPFEGLTDDEIAIIMGNEEKFYNSINEHEVDCEECKRHIFTPKGKTSDLQW